MSEFKGTPGPWVGMTDGCYRDSEWSADNDFAGSCEHAPILSSSGETVCLVTHAFESMEDESPLDANACLISAAPELLESLQEAMTILTDSVGDFDHDKAEAAIAKALGEDR